MKVRRYTWVAAHGRVTAGRIVGIVHAARINPTGRKPMAALESGCPDAGRLRSRSSRSAMLPLLLLLGLLRSAAAPITLHCDALQAASPSPSFCASIWATGLDAPRKVVVTAAGAVLVLDTPVLSGDRGLVLALWDADNDGFSDTSERATLLDGISGLGQGLAVSGGFLYASTGASVRRWPHVDGTRNKVRVDAAQTVVTCAEASDLTPRELAIDDASQSLYVVLGTLAPDQPSSVRKFVLSQLPPDGSFDCEDGTLIADGLRAEQLAIALDGTRNLWVVEGGNVTARLVPPVLTLASTGAPSTGIAFYGGASGDVCVNTSHWTLPSGTLAAPYYDYNQNGCPDSWEEDGLCDEEYGTGCPVGSDSKDCDSGGHEDHNACASGSFPCHMLGDAFIALSDGGSEGRKVLRLQIPHAATASPGLPNLEILGSELLSNGIRHSERLFVEFIQ
eukprot:COSAG02_NODE_6167_length_3754_cov_1.932148_1_plen_449_part_00